jgi:hypothetical protein
MTTFTFAQDPVAPGQLDLFLSVITDGKQNNFAALVDTGFDHFKGVPPFAAEKVNCYTGLTLEKLQVAAPCLIPFSRDNARDILPRLVEHCAGRPMLSFITLAPTADCEKIANQWEPLHWAHTSDGQQFLLRFADTRILPYLASVLTPEQWRTWGQNVLAWHHIDRRGWIRPLFLVNTKGQLVKKTELDDAQFARIVELGEADATLDAMGRNAPDIIPEEMTGSQLYQLMEDALQKARAAGIENESDRRTLIALAFVSQGSLLHIPELDAFLEKGQWEPEKLMDAIELEPWFADN